MAPRKERTAPANPSPAPSGLIAPRGDRSAASRRPRRWMLTLGVAGLVVVLVGLAVGLGPLAAPGSRPTAAAATATSSPGPSDSTGPGGPGLPGPGAGFLVTTSELQDRATLAEQGVQPYREAVADLLTFARRALVSAPHPEQPLDIPGTTGPFVDDTAAAYGLALAYAVTGQRDYADQAARYIMAWVDTTTSTVDACADSGACQTSLVMSRAAPGFVLAAALLASSGALSVADNDHFKAWLRAVVLPAASRLDNNWGDAGTFTRLAVTAYLRDAAGFGTALAKWRSQQDLIAADGHIPLEVRRERSGIGYTQEALDYKVAAAEIARHQGYDLWDYRGAGGGTLHDAVDYLARYWFDPDAWPWDPDPISPPVSGMWEIAYERWPTLAWRPIIEQRRPYDAQGHSAVRWTTLTNGLPFVTPAGGSP